MELLIVLAVVFGLIVVGYYFALRRKEKQEEEEMLIAAHTVDAETPNFPQHVALTNTQPKKVHTGKPFVVQHHRHLTYRRRILRHPAGGYYIEDMGMDYGVNLVDLIMYGFCVYQDVLDFQAEQEALGNPVDFDPSSLSTDLGGQDATPFVPVPEEYFRPSPEAPDWGDSHASVPEPSHWSAPEPAYSAPEPSHHYEAPSHHYEAPSHSDWGSSSSSSSDYSSSSSSSDCGGGGGGD